MRKKELLAEIGRWSEIDARAPRYYDEIISLCNSTMEIPSNIAFIVVDHCLLTFASHVESIRKLGRVAGVILKSSTRVNEVEDYANQTCNILDVTKEMLREPGVAQEIIREQIEPHEMLIILDHGGYFAPRLNEIMADEVISSKLLGIVEVTENGRVKHKRAIQNVPAPVLSIARTKLKELEDIQVGRSIVYAADFLMSRAHFSLRSIETVCIIGYGKIGRSIANTCKKYNIPEVIVLEENLLRALFAEKDGHKFVMINDSEERTHALKKAQMIFSATGNKALGTGDLNYIGKGKHSVVYIASCTSPDDEFSENFFSALEEISVNTIEDRRDSEQKLKFSPYEIYNRSAIHILNGGKAVNFALGGTPGFEICQVWAAIVYSACMLAARLVAPAQQLQELGEDAQLIICELAQRYLLSNTIQYNTPNRRRSHSSPALFQSQNDRDSGGEGPDNDDSYSASQSI